MGSVLIRNARLVNEGRELVAEQILPITTLVAKTSHRVADLFAIPDRGYLREGYWADLVLIKPEPGSVAVATQPILSQCGWTPFARRSFQHSVSTTIVSGQIAWHDKRLNDSCVCPYGLCDNAR
jgi:dihydroorotase